MAAKYWLKLYYEILDDPKIGQIRDALKWRFVECLLVAGECDEGGLLPDSAQMAWRVRANPEHLDTDLHELAEAGVLSRVDGRWLVTNFAKRQAAVSGAERVARFRERQRKAEYYAGDTGPLRDGNDTVTIRYTDTDTDTDKIRYRKDADTESEADIDACTATLTHWLDLTGVTLPADKDKRRDDYLQPIRALVERVDGDGERARELLDRARSDMVADGKTPYRPAAVLPVIFARLDAQNGRGLWGNQPAEFDERDRELEEMLKDEGLA